MRPPETLTKKKLIMRIYYCYGWQNVKMYSLYGEEFPIYVMDIKDEDELHNVCSYTHARNKSFTALIKAVKKAAGVKRLKVKVETHPWADEEVRIV